MGEQFKFEGGIRIHVEGAFHDLHNDFDFAGFNYCIRSRVVTLRWIRSSGDWVKEEEPAEIQLEYHNVARFEFRARDPEMPFTEDDCLADAGYWREAGWPDNITNGWEDGIFSSDAKPEDDWHRAFRFRSAASIVIQAARAEVKIKREPSE